MGPKAPFQQLGAPVEVTYQVRALSLVLYPPLIEQDGAAEAQSRICPQTPLPSDPQALDFKHPKLALRPAHKHVFLAGFVALDYH
jgi:hypothetical protein